MRSVGIETPPSSKQLHRIDAEDQRKHQHDDQPQPAAAKGKAGAEAPAAIAALAAPVVDILAGAQIVEAHGYWITAQATRSPAPPMGWLVWSSGLAWITTAAPSASIRAGAGPPLSDTKVE